MNKPEDDNEAHSETRMPGFFKFTIWDLSVVTALVAILFALPGSVVGLLVSISLLVAMLLGFFFFETMFAGSRRHWQTGTMQLMRRIVIRGFLYSAFVLAVGGLSLFAKGEF